MKLSWVGPIFDASGYASLSRNWVVALHRAGWDAQPIPISLEYSHTNHGNYGEICKKLLTGPPSTSEINIVNWVAPHAGQYLKPGQMNICYTMWETSQLPKSWVAALNKFDAVLVPSVWNRQLFLKSGVIVPIEVATPGIDPQIYPAKRQSSGFKGKYKFYSIFQWGERKNPAALLRAYISAFSGNSDVSLTIKTYQGNSFQESTDRIVAEIAAIKQSMPVANPPSIFLKTEKLSAQQIIDIHLNGDCFLLPSRGEGLGLPYLESMMIGNPTVGTRFSGNLEFMNNLNSYLIDYQLDPVFNAGAWAEPDQRWASVNVGELADRMLWIYNNQDLAREKASAARAELLEKFGWDRQLAAFENTLTNLYSSWKKVVI